jgi:hypothetical protein
MLAAKLNRVRELMAAPTTDAEKKAKMEELLHRLEDEQRKVQQRITDILGKVNAYTNAAVEVSGEITPGTLIEICQTALFVTEPLKKVRLRLDGGGGKLLIENLK